ncbi:MAG: type II toxin-antitoxin system RelE/ParE family toxin [Kiritimatiellales bacterium]
MASYKIIVKKSVAKDLRNIPQKDIQRILTAIQTLTDNPHPPQLKKLSGQERYRLRQGNCRVLYSIEDENWVVCVVKVGNRHDVYR